MAATAEGRVKITVTHEKLATPGEVEEWKACWDHRLDATEKG